MIQLLGLVSREDLLKKEKPCPSSHKDRAGCAGLPAQLSVNTAGVAGARDVVCAHRSSGRNPVCFAIRVNILGPSSSLS
jgi:hypothetical protein